MSRYDEDVKGKVMVSRRSTAIDFLRSIAIIAVVCVHSLPVPIINGGGGGFLSPPQLGHFLKSVCRYS